MKLTFTRKTKATQAYGRGSDNYYQAASYEIKRGGKVIGYINSPPRSYMAIAEWTACLFDADGVLRPYGVPQRTLRDLKAKLQEYKEDTDMATKERTIKVEVEKDGKIIADTLPVSVAYGGKVGKMHLYSCMCHVDTTRCKLQIRRSRIYVTVDGVDSATCRNCIAAYDKGCLDCGT